MSAQRVVTVAIPQDQLVAEGIRQRLEDAEIACCLLPAVEDLQTHFQALTQIEKVVADKGALVVVVSKEALLDNRFVSNVQYACELAERRTILVIYKIEDLPRENPLALYTTQAIVINASQNMQASYSHLTNAVKRILRHKDAPKAFRPRHWSKKIFLRAFLVVVLLGILFGVGSYLVPWITEGREIPKIATPIVFENPFGGGSVDQGIPIDRRFVPDPILTGDQKIAAQFSFDPTYIYQVYDFDNPEYDNLDVLNIGADYGTNFISSKDRQVIRQTQGSLQIAVAPTGGGSSQFLGFNFPHLISTDTIGYVGLRFFLGEYHGWSDVNRPNQVALGFSHLSTPLCSLDLSRQRISVTPFAPGDTLDLGLGWHTLEWVFNQDSSRVDIFLDGDKIGESAEYSGPSVYAQLFMILNVEYSTEWINFIIDDIIYGSDQPPLIANTPEDAPYRITPDEISYTNTFESPPLPGELVDGYPYVQVYEGKLRFEIGPDVEHIVRLSIPAKPVSEMNYFSMKYRLMDYQPENWSAWGYLGIKLESPALQSDQEYSIGIEVSRYGADYKLVVGKNDLYGWTGSFENFLPGFWHTLEMVIDPKNGAESNYILQFWHDGCLVGAHKIDPIEFYLGDADFDVSFIVDAGDYRQGLFAGELAELRIGSVKFDAGTER